MLKHSAPQTDNDAPITERLSELIRRQCDDVAIILDQSDDKAGHHLLVITVHSRARDDHRLWDDIGRRCRALCGQAVTLTVHSLSEVRYKTQHPEPPKAGPARPQLLYNAANYDLGDDSLHSPQEQYTLARDYHEHWHANAESFYLLHQHARLMHNRKTAAFLLHQSLELALKTQILLHNGSAPVGHWLSALGSEALLYNRALRPYLPMRKNSDRQRLNRLDSAYRQARYRPDYQISDEELDTLARDIGDVLAVVEKACLQKRSGIAG